MSARLPAWDDLQVFLATARAGTLAGAADSLGVNASTVQRRIGRLESDLGTRLFDRSQRGYALTSAAEELFDHVLTIEQEVLAVGRRVGGRDASIDGTVRVTTVDDLATAVLSPILARFRRRHPRVAIDLAVETAFSDLARRQADVAIRFGARPQGPDLVAKHVSRTSVALYASRSYLRKHGAPAAPEDLQHHYLIRGSEGMANLAMERLAARYGDPDKIAFRSESMIARMAAARDGIGIGFLAYFLCEPERSLVRVDLPGIDIAADIWMLIHVDLRRNARVRAFVDFVYDELRAQQSRFDMHLATEP